MESIHARVSKHFSRLRDTECLRHESTREYVGSMWSRCRLKAVTRAQATAGLREKLNQMTMFGLHACARACEQALLVHGLARFMHAREGKEDGQSTK